MSMGGAVGGSVRRGRGLTPRWWAQRAEVHDPGLVAALESLIDPETCGDPESSLRWTTKSCRTLAKALQDEGITKT